MKKKLSLFLILAMLLALLCGCGASAKDAAYSTEAKTDYSYYANESASGAGWAPMEADEAYYDDYEQPMAPEDVPAGTGLPANVKLIYTADMDVESTAFDTAVAVIERMVDDCGGYFESSRQGNYRTYRTASYTIRVPAEQFKWFCSAMTALSEEGEVLQLRNIYRNAEDVSEAYYDIESRLTTQKTKLERLQELLSKAEEMEDIITLESAISDTELVIERLTGSLRKYDSLVGYSTIQLNLDEVYKLSEVEQPVIGFGAKLAAAFETGCTRFVNNLEDLAIGFARGWVGWLIFFAVVALAIVLIHRYRKRVAASGKEHRKDRRARRKKGAAPEAPTQQPTAELNGERKE